MASFAEIEQQVVNLLPENGEVPYAEFIGAMAENGLGQYTSRLRLMKQRGMVQMHVRVTENGVVHTVSRGGQK